MITCLRAAGWVVGTVATGAEALVTAWIFEPDLIVVDLNLPFVDGLDAIRSLKSDEQTTHVPIVAITAHDPAGSESDARAAGCDDFVAKPCEPDALREIAERFVRRRA